jgi:hypothetical protein
MKFTCAQAPKVFVPITLTLTFESQHDVDHLFRIMNSAMTCNRACFTPVERQLASEIVTSILHPTQPD